MLEEDSDEEDEEEDDDAPGEFEFDHYFFITLISNNLVLSGPSTIPLSGQPLPVRKG